MQLNVPSIVCDGCADTITKAIHKLDSSASVNVNIETKQVEVDTQADESRIKEAIAAVGHDVN
ncbi:MAG TPA: heavy-metal-associated domain-containing protein [Elainellaceae cyanobacterium]